MKGAIAGNGRMHGGYSYRRWGNVYVVMMIVFSVFLCGILGIHSLRERRYFSLLNKQKDDQILSLHILLQKERDHLQEFKKKTEDMKMEITILGSQKAELNSKIADMQSTISSLREEQRAIETAFQEKQNEVRMMKEKEPDPRLEALLEDLRQKDSEIGDLKHSLQLQGSQVQPSNATAVQEGDGKNASEAEFGRSFENGGSEKKKEHEGDGESGNNQELDVHYGKMKMEVQDNTRKVRRRAYLRRVKGKRWRSITKQTGEERPPGNEGTNSSSEGDRDSLEEMAKKQAMKIENTVSENKDVVQHTEENEQVNVKLTEGRNEQQHTDLLGRNEGKLDAVERGDREESDVGEESQEKEETDEEF